MLPSLCLATATKGVSGTLQPNALSLYEGIISIESTSAYCSMLSKPSSCFNVSP